MKTAKNEIRMYYNPESASDRKTLAYAKSVSPHVIAYSHAQAGQTSTHWMSLFSKLNLDDPKKLLNKAHPEYQANIRGNEFDGRDWT
jgi:arsenate reductase